MQEERFATETVVFSVQVPWLYWDVLWMKEFDDGDYDDDNFLSHAATLLINYSYMCVSILYALF
tara:strand:- start:297 stop:488 length:192 start_codon:yes stop_codon:yes gene_type:complete